MKNLILLLCSFYLTSSIAAQSSIDPKDIKQSASARFVTDDQITLWSKPVNITSLSNAVITTDASHRWATDAQIAQWNKVSMPNGVNAWVLLQDDSHRFVTAQQIAGWDKKASESALTTLTANAVTVDADHQFVSAAEKIKWNKNTKIQRSFNIQFQQINDSTIAPLINIPSYNTYDRDRLPVPAVGEWIFILNTDTNRINFRTSLINWTALWSD